MKEVKNNLPKYWVVKLLEKEVELFQETVCAYMNEVYDKRWVGANINYFYGYDGNSNRNGTDTWRLLGSFKNNPTVLTLQEFIELSKPVEKIEMYSIEEVKTNPKIIVYLDSEGEWDILNKIVGSKVTSCYYGKYCYSVVKDTFSSSSTSTYVGDYDADSIIITLNQIKEANMNNKKIIGYELKPEFKGMRKTAEIIAGFSNQNDNEEYLNSWFSNYDKSSVFIKRLSVAGVLDIWFEPIYQEEEKFKVGDIVVVAKQQWPNRAQPGDIVKIIKIDDSDLPYKVTDFKGMYSNGSWCKSVRKATAEEIKSIKTKSFTFEDLNITVKEDRIVIENRGSISMDDFNSVVDAYEEITGGFELENSEYSVNFNITAVNVGCVKDIPVEAITTINNYLKAIK